MNAMYVDYAIYTHLNMLRNSHEGEQTCILKRMHM
jgi:hypothetical protein